MLFDDSPISVVLVGSGESNVIRLLLSVFAVVDDVGTAAAVFVFMFVFVLTVLTVFEFVAKASSAGI